MRKIDYNKIMYVIGIILIAIFCVLIIKDYTHYIQTNISVPFYFFVIICSIELILPGCILLYLYNQNTYVKERCYIVKSIKILEEFNGYKVAQISDFHNTNSKRIKKKLVKSLRKNKPDIIVITGDLIDSRRTNIQTAKEFLENIIDIAPIYYVLGNHESRLNNIDELITKIQEIGVKILRNKKIEVKSKKINDNIKNVIEIIGIEDPAFYVKKEERNEIKNKIDEKIIKAINENTNDNINKNSNFKILLTHRPELVSVYAKHKLDLVFTGHAHGGQIRIPGIGGIIAPGQGFFPKITKGIYSIGDTKLIVSGGIGNSKFPFRINNRPELVYAILKSE